MWFHKKAYRSAIHMEFTHDWAPRTCAERKCSNEKFHKNNLGAIGKVIELKALFSWDLKIYFQKFR